MQSMQACKRIRGLSFEPSCQVINYSLHGGVSWIFSDTYLINAEKRGWIALFFSLSMDELEFDRTSAIFIPKLLDSK